jgi:hypothetical protein
MDREKLLQIVKAAMAAAAAIVRVTPNVTDDKVYAIAEVIVNQVLQIFSSTEIDLEPTAEQAVALAVAEIRDAL